MKRMWVYSRLFQFAWSDRFVLGCYVLGRFALYYNRPVQLAIFRDYYMCVSISSWYYPETSISARGPLGQRADMGRGIIPGRYGKTHVIIFLSHIQRYKAALQNMFHKKQPLYHSHFSYYISTKC